MYICIGVTILHEPGISIKRPLRPGFYNRFFTPRPLEIVQKWGIKQRKWGLTAIKGCMLSTANPLELKQVRANPKVLPVGK